VSLLGVWLRNRFFNRFNTRARSYYSNQPKFSMSLFSIDAHISFWWGFCFRRWSRWGLSSNVVDGSDFQWIKLTQIRFHEIMILMNDEYPTAT
jgi:hypothetical protein